MKPNELNNKLYPNVSNINSNLVVVVVVRCLVEVYLPTVKVRGLERPQP